MESPPIRDQRYMVGDRVHSTVDDVLSAWRAWAADRGFRRPTGAVARELTLTELESPVYISAGCYVADCPNPECNGAAACWIENAYACCLDCGFVFRPAWPTAEMIGGDLQEAAAILGHRPKTLWRNFRASHKDETIADLKAQNLAVGDPLPGGSPTAGPHPLDPTLVRA